MEEGANRGGKGQARARGFLTLPPCKKVKSSKDLYGLMKGPGTLPGKFFFFFYKNHIIPNTLLQPLINLVWSQI